jgi:hypothetical protein
MLRQPKIAHSRSRHAALHLKEYPEMTVSIFNSRSYYSHDAHEQTGYDALNIHSRGRCSLFTFFKKGHRRYFGETKTGIMELFSDIYFDLCYLVYSLFNFVVSTLLWVAGVNYFTVLYWWGYRRIYGEREFEQGFES